MVFGIVRNSSVAVNERNLKIHEFYRKFAKFIGQETSVGELTADASTMETLISEKYRSITREYFYPSILALIAWYLGAHITININYIFHWFLGTIRVLDDTELNSDIKIKFKLDPDPKLNNKTHKCSSTQNGFSEDSIQCDETTNDDQIWIQVIWLIGTMSRI